MPDTSFESYVILNTTKTANVASQIPLLFESYIILNTTKTNYVIKKFSCEFESYVNTLNLQK